MAGKVIISCAVTGAIHTPSMSDHLPITPEEIARSSIEAAEAGAAIIHLHARDPNTGEPTPDPAVFMRFLPVIKQSVDAVVNITTGGGLNMTLDDRLAAPLLAKPEMCSLNMGSMNFNIARAGDRVKTWKHDWEKPYLDRTDDHIFRNTFRDIAGIVERLGKAHGTRFEFECYDVGHLYNLAYCLDQKIVEPPLFVQTIFGILGGIGADPRNLLFMKETADRLFGEAYVWSVLAAGPASDGVHHDGRHPRRQCARRAGGQPVYRPRRAGEVECRAGGEDPPHPGGTQPGDRLAQGGARDPQAEGRRPRRVLRYVVTQPPGAGAALTPPSHQPGGFI